MLRARPTLVVLAVVMSLSLLGCQRTKEGTLTIVNLAPYTVYYAAHHPVSETESVTRGWWKLLPGEQRTLTYVFEGVEPAFAVYANSAAPEMIRWLHGLAPDHPGVMYFEGGEADPVTFQHVKDEKILDLVQAGSKNGDRPEMYLAGFVEVPLDAKTNDGMYLIRDEYFQGLYDRAGIEDTDDVIAVLAERVRLFASTLERQRAFDERWPDPARTFPFDFGLVLDDHNGLDMPGVHILDVAPADIRGGDMPFLPGDILVSYGGHTVFSVFDMGLTLFEHGTSLEKGIAVPIPFELIRNGQRLAGETMYFFNSQYFGYSDQDRTSAALYGVGDAITLGAGATVKVAAKHFFSWLADRPAQERGDFKRDLWIETQRKNRLRQMYGDSYEVGAFLGMFTPSAPRLLLSRSLARNVARRGVARSVASIGATMTLEVAEGVIWTIADASPVQTTGEVIEDIKRVIPYAIGVGIVSGSLSRRVS